MFSLLKAMLPMTMIIKKTDMIPPKYFFSDNLKILVFDTNNKRRKYLIALKNLDSSISND